MGVDGVESAEGVDERGAGVHGHGDAQGFGNFLFGGAGFESGIGVESDATVATGGDGDGERDELADLLAEERIFGIGGGEGLIALEGIGRKFGEFGNRFGELGLVIIPVEEQGDPPEDELTRRESIAGKGILGNREIVKKAAGKSDF